MLTSHPGGTLGGGSSADSDWAAVIIFSHVIAGHETWCCCVFCSTHSGLGVHMVSLGFIGWQGIKSRYPQRGLCWEWAWGGWCLDTAAFSTASVLAAAYFMLFNAEVVGDGSGLSCPSSLVFPALDVLPASRSGFSEAETSIMPLHHVLCCEIHLECCSMACEKSPGLCSSLSQVKG